MLRSIDRLRLVLGNSVPAGQQPQLPVASPDDDKVIVSACESSPGIGYFEAIAGRTSR
jgi:hypothetical protein